MDGVCDGWFLLCKLEYVFVHGVVLPLIVFGILRFDDMINLLPLVS
jgi:hypothetical protein